MVLRHRNRAVVSCLVGLATVVPVRGDAPPMRAPTQASVVVSRVPGFENTQEWFRHLHSHQVWQSDAAAAAVATLPPAVLQRVAEDLRMVRMLLEGAASRGTARVDVANRRLKLFQLPPLMGLTVDELELPLSLTDLSKPDSRARVTISRLMMRAAALHTAIAVSPEEEFSPPRPAPAQRPAVGQGVGGRPVGSGATRPPIRIQDGRQIGVANLSGHWAIARAALDLVGPPPSRSSTVVLWYHATAAYMQTQRDYSALQPHLGHAAAILPSDAWTFLLSGATFENLAAVPVQSAIAEAGNVAIGLPAELRRQAERFLRRALELDPGSAPTRLRLGRVMQLQGDHAEAAVQLRLAESDLSNPVWRYFAGLYLGRAERALNRNAEARAAFGRAMALFPRAQSPRLALAEMSWMGANRSAAATDIRALFAVVDGAGRDEDPWWRYDVSHVVDAPSIWEEMRARMAEAARW